jgi:hypothetical protein
MEICQPDESQRRVFSIPDGYNEAVIWLEVFGRYADRTFVGAILHTVTSHIFHFRR